MGITRRTFASGPVPQGRGERSTLNGGTMLFQEWHAALVQALGSEVTFANAERTYVSACAVYAMDRMDRICVGADRHVRLARWVAANQRLFMRYDRARKAPQWRRARQLHDIIATAHVELSGLEG